MKLGIIDTETTGLNENSQVCEISITIYQIGNTKNETGAITSFSSVLPVPNNETETEEINFISPGILQSSEQFYQQSIEMFKNLVSASDYCMAFNAAFDKEKLLPLIGERNWICAMNDFDWGYSKKNAYGSYKLIDLALWLGIGISFHHRAGDDVRLLVECLNRMQNAQEFVDKGISRSLSPLVEVHANVSYDDRNLAKNAYFLWDADRKVWFKTFKECDLALLKSFPFQCKVLPIVK